MSVQTRLVKLEERISPDKLNIILIKPWRDKPLPEPVNTSTVTVSYCYADKPEN